MNYDAYLSHTVKSIPPSAIRRFFDLANELKGQVISLSIGEPDFVTPWNVREAGIFSLESGNTHYSPNQGFIELREAIAAYMKRSFDLSYQPRTEVLVTVGGSEAIDLAVRALVNPGDEVIIPEPCFVAYKSCVMLAGGVPVTISTRQEDDFKLLPQDLERAITSKTKLIILGYPNNPTGAVMSHEELTKIAEVLHGKDIIIVSDEIYAELTYPPQEHCSIATLDGLWERTIVVNGFSKAFAMTGWRLGFAVGPAPLIGAMNKIHQYAIMSSPTTAQDAAIEALNNGATSIVDMRNEYNRRRRIVIDACRKAGLPSFEPLGAFYAFPDIRPTGMDSTTFCETFLKEEKVAIVPGNAFGACGEGYVRISYASSMDNIREAMARLTAFVSRRINP